MSKRKTCTMLLKKIRHLNNFKNELVNQIVEIKSLKSKIEDLENKVKKQEEDLEFLKSRNTILENNNNIIIKDFSALAGSVSAMYKFLSEEFVAVEKVNNKKKITYH